MPNLKPISIAAAQPQPDPFALLASLPVAVLAVGRDRVIRFVNLAAQQLLDASESALLGQDLTGFVPGDSPLFALIEQAIQQDRSVGDYGMLLESPRIGRRTVSVTVAPLVDPPDLAVLSLFEESVARRIDTQLNRRHAARSMTAMAAMLAHEVKNPLSGIRGAAQLLEQTVGDEDRALTRLICDEADRISRAGRPDGGVRRRSPIEPRAGQHPRGAGACAPAGADRLRPPCPLRRALRPVAAAGVGAIATSWCRCS